MKKYSIANYVRYKEDLKEVMPNDKLYQDYTRNEIIEHAVQMIDPNFDHPFAWNGLPVDLLQEAKELWKVN